MENWFTIAFFCLTATVALVNCDDSVRYDGYKLYKVFTETEEHYNFLQSLMLNTSEQISFWKEPYHVGEDSDIMVSPDHSNSFEILLKNVGIQSEISIEDVQGFLDSQGRSFVRNTGEMEWSSYHSLQDIYAYLDNITASFPKQATPINIGTSHELRPIRGVKISYKRGNKAIFIEANMHAREWISSATATWIIKELLTSTDRKVRNIAENLDWYIIPVLNPDGFVYTHTKDRLWRKTRQDHNISSCVGVDPNRNFDFLWMVAGASTNPCSEIYAGPEPNSEPEVKAVTSFITSIEQEIIVYISLHSYSQLVVSPWGHTAEEFPENYNDMLAVAKGFVDAVKTSFGTKFSYGSSATVLYEVSGSSKEWAYGVAKIPVTYTIELRDTGRYGFVLPPDQIIPTGQEVVDGLVGLLAAAKEIKLY